MNNYSIIDQHTSDLPDYDLVGCGEIGIPLYNCRISFLYSEKKSLPILLEFILNLIRERVDEKDMAQLLAIDEDVISDGIASLYQTDYINPLSKELTPKGYEYLEKNQIDSFEKGEMDVLIDALTGNFDFNVNSHMSQSVAKSNNLSCIRCYIQQPTIDNIDYNNLKKAFNQFKTKNEWTTAGDIIEVISVEKQSMRYKRICILIFQNKGGDVRIQAYDRSRKNEKYEQILKNMDENDNVKILRDNVGEFFESGECTKIYSELESVFNLERICNFKSYMEFFENEINCTVVIPLIEPINITNLFYYQLESKLKKKETITLIISGNEFLSSTQENLVYKLLLLCDTYDNLIMKQFPILVPSMIYTNNKGKISRLEQTNINLKTTQNGLVERFYDLTEHDINKVFEIIPKIKENELISFDFTEMNRDEIKEKMKLLKRLIYDCV